MDDRSVARGVATMRLAFGLLLLLAPRLVVRRSGTGAEPPKPYVWWLRAFGVRDAILGVGTLLALEEGDDPDAARWVQAGAAADTLDAATAVVFGRDMDRRSRLTTIGVAAPLAAFGWRAGQALASGR